MTEQPEELDPKIDFIDYDYLDDLNNGQIEETVDDAETGDVFYRKNRMDVKKPGPFVEASPNNFYLDKLTYRYDTDDENDTKIEDQGQEEYEIPMPQPAPSKEKRMMIPIDAMETEDLNIPDDYVHIALNNK